MESFEQESREENFEQEECIYVVLYCTGIGEKRFKRVDQIFTSKRAAETYIRTQEKVLKAMGWYFDLSNTANNRSKTKVPPNSYFLDYPVDSVGAYFLLNGPFELHNSPNFPIHSKYKTNLIKPVSH